MLIVIRCTARAPLQQAFNNTTLDHLTWITIWNLLYKLIATHIFKWNGKIQIHYSFIDVSWTWADKSFGICRCLKSFMRTHISAVVIIHISEETLMHHFTHDMVENMRVLEKKSNNLISVSCLQIFSWYSNKATYRGDFTIQSPLEVSTLHSINMQIFQFRGPIALLL